MENNAVWLPVTNNQNDSRYTCDVCFKSYRWRTHFNDHRRTNCGKIRNFECTFCGYRSNKKWNLKLHLRRVHEVPQSAIRSLLAKQ